MLIPLVHCHVPLRFLLLYTLPQLILARVPITPLPLTSLFTAFNLYPTAGKGGCDRNAPNGVPMFERTLKSLGGASAIAQTVAQDLPTYPTQVYIRGLLFLFFGITFQMNHELNPDIDNMLAYYFILDTFGRVNQVFLNPTNNLYRKKPRYRCLEDYATYYTHPVDANGQADLSQPSIGESMNNLTEGGFTRPPPWNDIWPGMMFVHNVQINNRDRTYGWYTPSPASPPSGKCGTPALEHDAHKCVMFTNSNFTKTDPAVQALFGITACPAHFDEPTLLDLGTPVPNSGFTEIRKFQKTPDLDDLHELFHLVSHGGIIDQFAAIPPAGDWFNMNWAAWIPSTVLGAYGYGNTAFLGLAMPWAARLNADSFTIFALCVYFPELDCLGAFQTHILTKRSVPVGVSPRAVEKIRSEGLDRKRDLGLGREPAEAEDFGQGFKEKGRSRFKDVFRPSALFG